MQLSAVFEAELTSKAFPNIEAAKKWLGQHPIAGEYLLEHFLAREVIAVLPDYSVGKPPPRILQVGEVPLERDRRKNKGKWGATWPSKSVCLAVIRESGSEGIRMKTFERNLRRQGVDVNHWLAYHALRNLVASGEVRAVDGVYYSGDGTPPSALFPGLPSMAEAEIACNAAEAARDPAFLKLPNAQAIHNYIDLHYTAADTPHSLSDAIRVAFGVTVSPATVLLERIFAESLRTLGEADLRERPNG